MTLEQLRIFVAVAEREHVTRAAAALGLTQSAVSGAIQALEARHGVALFARVGRRIELSADGRVFFDHARAVLSAAQAAERSLQEMRGLERGVVSIHASQTTGAYWVPERLARFHAAHPGIDIRMAIGNSEQVAAAVVNGGAEIGFVEDAVAHPDLQATTVDIDRLVVVVGRAHPWHGLARITPAQAAVSAWVLRERGSGTRAVFEQALARHGVRADAIKVALELPSNEAVRSAVVAGAGATAISRVVADAALRAKTLHALRFVALERAFILLKHRERAPSQAARAFVAMIDQRRTASPA